MHYLSPRLMALLILGAACTSEPTSTGMERTRPDLAATGHVFMGGPPKIHISGNYTYTAYAGLLYPNFQPWGFRACPSASIAACTTPWTSVLGIQVDEYTQKIVRPLTVDCTPPGKRAYQVRAIASGFGHPPDTAYYVTLRCDPDI